MATTVPMVHAVQPDPQGPTAHPVQLAQRAHPAQSAQPARLAPEAQQVPRVQQVQRVQRVTLARAALTAQ
jgi:hypothetical protein